MIEENEARDWKWISEADDHFIVVVIPQIQ
jgi:hypothetical protein